MGKSKQTVKEKKFDRNVEISAPILDPEIIKAIHTPPKGGRLDIKHGGFKALLSDLNSQDSTDELTPLNDDHVPSYIGISCAVSGYSNYSSYSKRPACAPQVTPKTAMANSGSTLSRSRATSPVLLTSGPEIHHITIDKSAVHSADEERKELTEKLTASATERRRSPSPCIPPTEDDRHHGAYVGARYCPLPAPSKIVNKHIPLLGIDDEQDPDQEVEEEKKVEQRIASLYGGDFVEDWREAMTHKAKKELAADQVQTQSSSVKPKDLVTLKPTPPAEKLEQTKPVEVPVPNVKVLAGVEKQFLNKLLTDDNPPYPQQPSSPSPAPTKPLSEVAGAQAEVPEPVRRDDIIEAVVSRTTNDVTVTSEPSRATLDDIITFEPSAQLVDTADVSVTEPTTQTRDDIITFDSDDVVTSSANAAVDVATHDDIIQVDLMGGGSSAINQFDESPMAQEAATEITHELMTLSSSPVNVAEQLVVLGTSEEPEQVAPMSPDSGKSQSFTEEELVVPARHSTEEHIEYEIRAQSPLDNESSPVKEPQSIESEVVSLIGNLEVEQKDEKVGSEVASDSRDGRYYLDLLDREKSFILEQVARAETLLESEEGLELDEDRVGRLRSAIGKANLLVNKKFNQFKELCEANINKSGDEKFATLNDDLAGFWDMLSIQVANVRKSLDNLWEESPSVAQVEAAVDESLAKEGPREKQQSGGKPKLSAKKDKKRRERLQEHISQMKRDQAAKMSDEDLLDD